MNKGKSARLSIKHLQIDKENATMLLVVGACAAVAVFCLISSKSLYTLSRYHAKVIDQKKDSKSKIDTALKNLNSLETSYKLFVGNDKNALGASPKPNPSSPGKNEGDNAKLILDALPSKYDFPAFATSLEKFLTDNNYSYEEISGSDDILNQNPVASANPVVVEIPFSISSNGQYDTMKKLISDIEHIIRPMQVSSMTISATEKDLKLSIQGKTFYKPEKSIHTTSKVIAK